MLELIRRVGPRTVYVDALTARPARFGRQLEAMLYPLEVRVIAENHADERYPVVQAASMVAKVTRDAAIERLGVRFGRIGSGYPSDPRTKAFLERMKRRGGWPACVRESWSTVARLESRTE